MLLKVYDIKNEILDQSIGHLARTLPPKYLETHRGWTITGVVKKDYYKWVNFFEATHAEFGEVYGNYDYKIFASSKEGYLNFCKHFPFHEWDYDDI